MVEEKQLDAAELEALNAHIFETSQAKNFIPVTIADSDTVVITFLDIVTSDKKTAIDSDKKVKFTFPIERNGKATIEDRYTISLQPFSKFVKLGTYQICISVTQEQIKDLKEQWNIDVLEMVKNVAISEYSQSISKQYLKRISALAERNKEPETWIDKIYALALKPFGKKHVKTIKIKNEKELLRQILAHSGKILHGCLRGPADFVIVNMRTGAALQNNAEYVFAPIDSSSFTNFSAGIIYPIGTVAGMKIYVDPYMTWKDNTVIMGRIAKEDEPGLHLIYHKNGLFKHPIIEGTGAPKIRYESRFAFVETGFHPESYYTKFVYKSPHKGYGL
jgi:hypothetical protein